jgi:hypothetical protein
MTIKLGTPPESDSFGCWDELADGQWYALVVGEDTPKIPVDTFRKRAYSAARRRGLRAQTRVATVTNTRNSPQVAQYLAEGKTVILLKMEAVPRLKASGDL